MNRIRHYRKEARMTQSELAAAVGARRETITNLEKERYNPSLAMADRIAETLNRTIYDLFPDLLSSTAYSEVIKHERRDASDKTVQNMASLASKLS